MKILKKIVYGLLGISLFYEPSEIFAQGVIKNCPDYLTCVPKTGNMNRDCNANVMPQGLSKGGLRVLGPIEQSTYKFSGATDWKKVDQWPVCHYEYKQPSTGTVYDAVFFKEPGASFHADKVNANLWEKVNDDLDKCNTTSAQNCPFY